MESFGNSKVLQLFAFLGTVPLMEILSLHGCSPDLSENVAQWEADPSVGYATKAPGTIGSSKLLGRVGKHKSRASYKI